MNTLHVVYKLMMMHYIGIQALLEMLTILQHLVMRFVLNGGSKD